jgi:hypothetical protein
MEENYSEKRVLNLPKIFLYIVEIIVVILLVSYVYYSRAGNQEYEGIYSEHSQKKIIEALFTSLKLQDIHEIPYLNLAPIIQIHIEQDKHFVNSYYLKIIKGEVQIKNGITSEKDIIIRTTIEEIEKIMENQDYIKESLISGRTEIEKTASDFVLFSKGYPNLFIKKDL